MILANGVLYPDEALAERLAAIECECLETIRETSIQPEVVIDACERLVKKVEAGEYDHVVREFLGAFRISEDYFRAALNLFRRENLVYQCRMAWGESWQELSPLRHPGFPDIRRRRMSLGVLFHIAAGNVDGLPAYSVIEGLLAGNINILKLPSADRGLSVLLLHELVKLEPALKRYVYVFDVPSTDLASLQKFATVADGVVVWGGDEAVKAARRLVDCHTKIITWGHKLSFAYATTDVADSDILALAHHIRATGQTLCSSCQGVYLDTQDKQELFLFARRLFAALKVVDGDHPRPDPGLAAQAALYLYNDQLEATETGRKILRGEGVSVTVCPDQELELSRMFGNCWVKALPRLELVSTLKGKKGLLQTCGLLCKQEEREELGLLLARAGVVRVTEPGEMSRSIPGEAHDGLYPLVAYTRIVELV